ncbi:MAG: AMP-binding protein, partial [Acidobacteriota bacterium]
MQESKNIIDVLRARAADTPDRIVFSFLRDGVTVSESVTFGELDRRARETAAWLQARFPPGARALLLHPPGIDFIVAFFGCAYAGMIAIPAYPPRGREIDPRLKAMAADAGAAAAFTTPDVWPKVSALIRSAEGFGDIQCATSDEMVGDAAAWRDLGPTADTPVHLQYTSGSTSTPKGVIVTHANLMANLRDMDLG